MKRRTKIALWVYLVGVVLTEIINIRTGYVMGAFERMHNVIDTAVWLVVGIAIAATWPLWVIMIALQFLGLENKAASVGDLSTPAVRQEFAVSQFDI